MRAADAWAIEERGHPGARPDGARRRRAGARDAPRLARRGPVRVVCGKGNNGGDGLVVARLLREEGREVDVLAVGDLSETKGDARANLDRLPGDPPRAVRARASSRASGVIVDAMLGTGFEGEPREPVAGAIAAINDAGRAGRRLRRPLRRERVHRRGRGRTPCGPTPPPPSTARRSASTSIPARSTRAGRGRRDRDPARRARGRSGAGLIADGVLELVPPRPRSGTKFKSGVVVVAGGARGLTGAPTHGRARRDAHRRRLRAGGRAGVDRADVRPEAAGGDDARHARGRRRARRRRASSAVLELCERAGALVARPGHRPDRRRARVGARGRAARAASRC